MRRKKSDLNNPRSRAARRKRAERALMSAEQIATRNAAQRIRMAEARARKSQQRDTRMRVDGPPSESLKRVPNMNGTTKERSSNRRLEQRVLRLRNETEKQRRVRREQDRIRQRRSRERKRLQEMNAPQRGRGKARKAQIIIPNIVLMDDITLGEYHLGLDTIKLEDPLENGVTGSCTLEAGSGTGVIKEEVRDEYEMCIKEEPPEGMQGY